MLNYALQKYSHYLGTYMHYQLKAVRKPIGNYNYIEYRSKIYAIEEYESFVAYYHSVKIYTSLSHNLIVTKGIVLPKIYPGHDISIYISEQYIPLSYRLYTLTSKFNGIINLTSIGLTGKIKDLFVPMPNLATIYNEDEFLSLNCNYSSYNQESNIPKIIILMECSFIITNYTRNYTNHKALLNFQSTLNITYEPDVKDSYLAARITKISSEQINTYPKSPTILLFTKNICKQVGKLKFESLEIPMIRYMPYRSAEYSSEDVKDRIYGAHYDY